MRTVAQNFFPAEAYIPLSKLQSAGIEATLRDDSPLQMNWMWSNAIGGVKIAVPDDEYESALSILELEPLEPSILLCPNCNSPEIAVHSMGAA